jgi:hypothetical protein
LSGVPDVPGRTRRRAGRDKLGEELVGAALADAEILALGAPQPAPDRFFFERRDACFEGAEVAMSGPLPAQTGRVSGVPDHPDRRAPGGPVMRDFPFLGRQNRKDLVGSEIR